MKYYDLVFQGANTVAIIIYYTDIWLSNKLTHEIIVNLPDTRISATVNAS